MNECTTRRFDGRIGIAIGPPDYRLDPPVRASLLVGGNGDRVLRLAAQLGDIVGFTGLGRTRPDGQRHEMEWEDHQIDAKVIQTPVHDAASYAGIAEQHPLGRLGAISDVVGAILYLERATFVTGETLHVDGGWAAGH